VVYIWWNIGDVFENKTVHEQSIVNLTLSLQSVCQICLCISYFLNSSIQKWTPLTH